MVELNPFRARNITPGRLPYFFPPGHDIDQLVERFLADGMRSQIIGPHGTGKTTLLHAMVDALRRRQVQALSYTVNAHFKSPKGWTAGSLKELRNGITRLHLQLPNPQDRRRFLAIDGFETASRWDRWRFFPAIRKADWGLLVTTHRDVGLPVLWETNVTKLTAQQVTNAIYQLESESGDANVEPGVPDAVLESLLANHSGDLREVLFSLYDWHANKYR